MKHFIIFSLILHVGIQRSDHHIDLVISCKWLGMALLSFHYLRGDVNYVFSGKIIINDSRKETSSLDFS